MSENTCTKKLYALGEYLKTQSKDSTLWFKPSTAHEEYLQQEIRRIYNLIFNCSAERIDGETLYLRNRLNV